MDANKHLAGQIEAGSARSVQEMGNIKEISLSDEYLDRLPTKKRRMLVKRWMEESMPYLSPVSRSTPTFKLSFTKYVQAIRKNLVVELSEPYLKRREFLRHRRSVLGSSTKYPLLEESVLKIQCWYRGIRARYMCISYRNKYFEEYRPTAIILIQSWFRSCLARRRAFELIPKRVVNRDKAAYTIQRNVRGYLARRKAEKLADSVRLFDEIMKMRLHVNTEEYRSVSRILSPTDAAIIIQAWYRSAKARAEARSVADTINRIEEIERIDEGYQETMNKSEEMIITDSIPIQRELTSTEAALKIQVFFRRYLARKLIRGAIPEEEAARTIQVWFRSLLARNIALELPSVPMIEGTRGVYEYDEESAALAIQTWYRGRRARCMAMGVDTGPSKRAPEFHEMAVSVKRERLSSWHKMAVRDGTPPEEAVQLFQDGFLILNDAIRRSVQVSVRRSLEQDYSGRFREIRARMEVLTREEGTKYPLYETAALAIQSWYRGMRMRKVAVTAQRDKSVRLIQTWFRAFHARSFALAICQ